jgi:polyphenol oxidase
MAENNSVENTDMPGAVFVARDEPAGVLVAVSEGGTAPHGTPSPTAFLARRFAQTLGVSDLPIVRASQVHGARVVTVTEPPPRGDIRDAGPCDALVTRLSGVALAVQTADCVPVLLAARDAVGAIHAGWRGAAADVTGVATEALIAITDDPSSARAWLGPSIGACCYEVGREVAARFPAPFARSSEDGRFLLDLRAVVQSQLEAAGVARENITPYPFCTMCGGERFASYRRDREKAGRMIALVARFT